MPYGLHELGFTTKTLAEIRDEFNAALQAAFGASIDLTDRSKFGQLIGIFSEHLSLLWELLEMVYSSQDPDKAAGAALEALCLITGTLRPAASYSSVLVTLTGDPTTIVPSGTRSATDSTEIEFATTENATIGSALTAWATATAYVVGDQRTANDGCYVCITAGTSYASGTGPEAPDFLHPVTSVAQDFDNISDGTVVWVFMGEGTGVIETTALATTTGPVEAVAYDIRTKVNSVTGWDGVINLLDANLGRDIATDSELRRRREQELAAGGSSPINALRAELLRITEVTAVTVFVNNTDTTDADGVPPHSIEALVRGPDIPDADFDQAVWDTLLAGVAAGIRTYGDEVGSSTDDAGNSHVMMYSRPTPVPIYVEITVIKEADEYPDDGDDLIKEAIVEWGDQQTTGKNAVSARISAAAFDVPGVLDVTACLISTAPGPTLSTTIPISFRELATYDTSRVSVITSDGVP